jgi:hypothetical protein
VSTTAEAARPSLAKRYDRFARKWHRKVFNVAVPSGVVIAVMLDGGITREVAMAYVLVMAFACFWVGFGNRTRYLKWHQVLRYGPGEINRRVGLVFSVAAGLIGLLLPLTAIVYALAVTIVEAVWLPFDFVWDFSVNWPAYAAHLAHAFFWFPHLFPGSAWALVGFIGAPAAAVAFFPAVREALRLGVEEFEDVTNTSGW